MVILYNIPNANLVGFVYDNDLVIGNKKIRIQVSGSVQKKKVIFIPPSPPPGQYGYS